MNISVIGLGKLGSPMAACFAAKGFTTLGVDVNDAYVAALNEGRSPVFEPQLSDMIAAGRTRLSATTDTVKAVEETDATFVIVPTPSDEGGRFSLEYVLRACEAIGAALRTKPDYHLVVLTSTVMPGSTGGPVRAALEEASGKRAGLDFGLCYSPEFIALGSVVRDFLNPDFLLIGESDERAGQLLADIYRRVVENDAPAARLSFVNAELAKMSVNTFVTMKIAFANTLARMCEALPDGDVDQVTSALGLDTRIGRKYLRGATSYGGPCFPRDNRALAVLGRELGVPVLLAEATDMANQDGIDRLGELVLSRLPSNGTVGILGLSYKPDTDVVEESPGVHLARRLDARGAAVIAFDPAGVPNARRALTGTAVGFAASVEECVAACHVLVITTPWPEFAEIEASSFERAQERLVVIDCWRILTALEHETAAEYISLGKGPEIASALLT